MLVETGIGPLDQRGIETFPRNTGLVIGDEENARSNRIEGEGHPSDTIVRLEAKLFHVGMLRTIERIRPGPSQSRARDLQKLDHGQQLVLNRLLQLIELAPEFMVKLDPPAHSSYPARYVFERVGATLDAE
ncbi:hypothetical protein OICFNHDK_2533 [Methylobacterium bullatum]|uniref:Uncharacterized protein n=1 Tax=Methylobacterium bullatum TaxID=570505 RepID=A0AAV4Z7R9_9HYPH|nr:hypothetical protein OICFNHDK_2533 [Methylobacterium bullatum]